jgi:hypothetical protein
MQGGFLRVLGGINVLLATLSFLLSLAPFTPAIAIFSISVPVAVVTARRGLKALSITPVFMWLLAVSLAPLPASALLKWPVVLWTLSVGTCGAYVLAKVFSMPDDLGGRD